MHLSSRIPSRFASRALAPLLAALLLAAPGAARAQAPAEEQFLAATLGLTPFVSGLYLSERPARGILFTAVDLLSAMGVYTAHYSPQGRPDYVRGYFLVMTGNNLLDAFVSTRYARRAAVPRAFVLPAPGGGVAGALRWTF